MKWMDLIAGGLIFLICLMPVFRFWALTLPLLGLLLILSPGPRRIGGWEFGLFGLILGISAAVSTGFTPGRNGFTPQALLETGGWILMAWLVGRSIPREFGRKLLQFLVFTSLIWFFIGFQQLAAGITTNPGWLSGAQNKLIPIRIYSVFVNPNIYALYLLGILVLAVEFAATSLNRALKSLYGAVAGLALVSLYFTFSRMAWILAGVFGFGRLIHRWKLRGWLITGAIILGLLALPAFRIRIATPGLFTDSSLQYRMRIWRGVVRALGDYWLWGSGPGSFGAIYPLYQFGKTPGQHAHQLFLQIWLEYGIFSLAAFLLLMIKRMRNGEPDFYGIRKILLMFLVYGFSETWYMNHYVGGFFWLVAGLASSGAARERGANYGEI